MMDTENRSLQKYQEKKRKRNSRFRVGNKLPELKKQRRRRLWRTYFPTIFIFLVIGLIALYFVSPLSKLAGIEVQTDTNFKNSGTKVVVPFKKGDSVPAVLRRLKKTDQFVMNHNAHIEKTSVRFKVPNKLVINVEGVSHPAYVSNNNQYYSIYSDGAVSKTPVNVPNHDGVCVISGFQGKSAIRNLLVQYKKLPNRIMNKISVIENAATPEDPQKIKLVMDDGNQVYVKIDTLVSKMEYYPNIAKTLKGPSVVDMEVGAFSYPIGK